MYISSRDILAYFLLTSYLIYLKYQFMSNIITDLIQVVL